ncbi:TonB-dependent receptor [Sphingobium boeckii]|uniref:Outer membrane receptor protein involved in Fe transport n=1 Tax=Sphingobium boeckii TaxID=1082345 RepID=A0A7W9AHN7_9SPHN|nr:TonB-dependent receptor [Sphingobium boeckii]MBB5685883.1 outer membrane receptor protein involved in Fe transport [Sphingobium boeckii]
MATQAVAAEDQEAATVAASDTGVGDIIVTAQKREQSLSKVGLTISAVTSDMLSERAIQSPADIAQAVPGLTFTNSANNTPVYTLRGVGFYDTSLGSYPTTSVYIDQVPLPFPILTSLTAFDLERVEVLKGPQGTLFGQNSTGGAINYIAAKPTSDLSAGVEASYGRFNTFTGSAFISGPLGQDIRARLAVRGSRGGPWQKSYTRDDENGRTRELAGRLLVDWDASDTLKFELNLNAWQDKSDPQAVQYLAFNEQAISNTQPVRDYPRSPLTPRAADWSVENGMYMNRKLGQASLRADWEFVPDISLTSITSYVSFKERGAMDQDGMNLQDIDLPLFIGRIDSFSQELRLANSANSGFRWIVGANYSRDKVYYQENLTYDDSSAFFNYGITTSENYSDQKMRNIAAFGNGELDLGDKLTVKAGLRYTDSRRTADICNHDGGNGLTAAFFNAAFGLNPPLGINDCFALDANFQTGLFTGELKEDNLSWRGGLDFKASDNLLLYANVAKGYKAGGYGNINASAQVQYAPAVQESILNYEAGFKLQAANRRVSLNGAVFYMDYKDKQLRSKLIDGTFGVLDAIINIPKSHLQGAEIELQARPVTGLSFGFAMTYIDSKIDRYIGVNAGGVTADFAGSSVPFTPKWQGSANMRFDIPMSDSVNLFGGTQLTYRSATNAIVGETPLYAIDDYALVDLQFGLESADDRWKVMLWGKNVTNEYYWNNVVAGQDTVVRYAARPATYGITLGYKY